MFRIALLVLLLLCTICGANANPVAGAESEVNDRISRMLSAKEAVTTPEQRQRLAADILRQVKNPMLINQGRHNTCALAAAEARTYTLYPLAAVDLVCQVAINGTFVTDAGEKIVMDKANLQPDAEATIGGYGSRSYASQLFQLTAANIYWQRQQRDPRGIECQRGSIHYIQKQISLVIPNDTGERLQINWEDGTIETVVEDSGRPVSHPCVSLAEVQKIGSMVAHQPNDTFVIAAKKFDPRQKYIPVKSVDDLRSQLIRCQRSFKMPLIAAVDLKSEMFKDDANNGWHAVCITAYDAQNDSVSVDNFWGPNDDRVGEKSISLPQLYSAISAN